jgi:putative two-component system response regulator
MGAMLDTAAGRVGSRILVVDDEPHVRDIVARWLTRDGYSCDQAESAEAALNALERQRYDLVLSDIAMPNKSGFELLGTIRQRFPDLAVIMITAVDDRRMAVRTLEEGAYGFLTKPLDRNELLINIINALERRRLTLQSKEYMRRLEHEVWQRTADIRRREQEVVLRLVAASEWRDDNTGAHIRRIGLYSGVLAQALDLPAPVVETIQLAATMHDVGKIGVPDEVLFKSGKLTVQEMAIMRRHAEIGHRILGRSENPLLQMAAEIALSHHEKWDGSGYPQGLSGSNIPQSSRIVAVADVYDALVHARSYKPAFPEDEAIELMRNEEGKHFDPEVLQSFLEHAGEFRQIRQEVKSP